MSNCLWKHYFRKKRNKKINKTSYRKVERSDLNEGNNKKFKKSLQIWQEI